MTDILEGVEEPSDLDNLSDVVDVEVRSLSDIEPSKLSNFDRSLSSKINIDEIIQSNINRIATNENPVVVTPPDENDDLADGSTERGGLQVTEVYSENTEERFTFTLMIDDSDEIKLLDLQELS